MDNKKFEKLNNCPYCTSINLEALFTAKNWFGNTEERFYLSKCNDCKIVFQNPRVKEENIGTYYTDDLGYYSPTIKTVSRFKTAVKSFLEAETLSNHFNYQAIGHHNIIVRIATFLFKRKFKIKMTPNFVPGGKLLEIGCSHGANLKRMKDLGWEVIGSEMNIKSSEYAKNLGLDIRTDRIENLIFPNKSIDAVIMGMVLEHIYQPFQILGQITAWLKPAGQLVFSIPYFEGFEYGLFKEYTYGLHLPHHITFLNKKIIKECLKKLGYKNIRFYFHYFDRDIVASAGYKYSVTKKYRYKLLSENKFIRYFFVKPLVYVLSLLGRTSRVTVYAEKK